jgi:hypothetical protein
VSKFPDPPPRRQLAARLAPEVKRLRRGTLLWRLYRRGGPHPVAWNRFRHWGPAASARFDHHAEPARAQARGILYAGLRLYTCVAEVFQHTRTIERSRSQPWLVGFELAREVSLLDLTGRWPTRAGASMALCSGPRSRTRPWSRAIYDAYREVQGLYYPSSMNAHRPAVALYERAMTAFPRTPLVHRPLSDPALLADLDRVAGDLGYRLV